MVYSNETVTQANGCSADVMEVFGTPILQYYWPDSHDLNAELKKVVLSKMKNSPGVLKTNRGGWQSDADLHQWEEDCIKTLLARVRTAAQEMVKRIVAEPNEQHLQNWQIRAWANVNRKGAFNKAHHHDGPNSLWSGFYYVDVGDFATDQTISGRTMFEDRNGVPKEIIRNADPYEREISIIPKPSLMILFPARTYHYAQPYSGNGVRITIAFNLWHSGCTVPIYEGMREGN